MAHSSASALPLCTAWLQPPALQEFDDFLAALAPLLSRLSFAFARVVLVCEGGPGFQAQVRWHECGRLSRVAAALASCIPTATLHA